MDAKKSSPTTFAFNLDEGGALVAQIPFRYYAVWWDTAAMKWRDG